ncbi:MAG: hypothetical protein ACI8XM_000230 [Haloarculaceae archaeon]
MCQDMGDETQPETEEQPEEETPAHILLHESRTPTPAELEEHPDIDATPTQVYQYRQARTAGAHAEAAQLEARSNEVATKFLLYTAAGIVLWMGFEAAVDAASGY